MAIPRAVANNIDRLAARLALLTERAARLERSAHRHEGGLALQPVGTILDYIGTVAPSPSWVILQGQTLLNAATNFPALWNIAPASLKSGNSLILPDTRGRVLVGYNPADADFDDIGKSGGVKTVALTTAQLPSHTHGAGTLGASGSGTLFMSGVANTGGVHSHLVRDYPTQASPTATISSVLPTMRGQRGNVENGQESTFHLGHTHSVAVSGADHGHGIAGSTGSQGSGDAHPNLQPFVVTVKILKVV